MPACEGEKGPLPGNLPLEKGAVPRHFPPFAKGGEGGFYERPGHPSSATLLLEPQRSPQPWFYLPPAPCPLIPDTCPPTPAPRIVPSPEPGFHVENGSPSWVRSACNPRGGAVPCAALSRRPTHLSMTPPPSGKSGIRLLPFQRNAMTSQNLHTTDPPEQETASADEVLKALRAKVTIETLP